MFGKLFCTLTIVFSTLGLVGQSDLGGKRGSVFFYWGYNRSIFSKSNLHFAGPNYDFTLYDITASDRPTKPGLVYLYPPTATVPQYNFRLGYFINDRLSVSGGLDHMKYVVHQNQEVRISGVITSDASTKYAGTYLNDTIALSPDFLQFEHSDGFNLVSLDFEYLLPISSFWKDRFSLLWNTGFGGIWIVTKTAVKVMGDGLDNDFHVAGYTMAAKTGPRLEYKNRWFLLAEVKGGYASLPSVHIKNAAPEIGDHNLSYLEFYMAVGVNLRFKRPRKKGEKNSITPESN